MWDFRHNDVTGLESEESLFPVGPFCSDHPTFIKVAPESGTPSGSLGIQVVSVRPVMVSFLRDGSDTEGIVMVFFWIPKFGAVIFCPAATGALHIPEDPK